MVVSIILDVETTGLPKSRKYNDLEAFDKCRMVSICWEILDSNNIVCKREHFYIRPDGFSIPGFATKIHGISQAYATEHGKCIKTILKALTDDMKKYDVKVVVAHNASFDMNVIRSELYRIKNYKALSFINKKEVYCTMLQGRRILKLKKNPKLTDLLKLLTGTGMTEMHQADVDTEACRKCYCELCGRLPTRADPLTGVDF